MEIQEEMDCLVDLDTLDRRVIEATLVPLACHPSLTNLSIWRKENQEPLESAAFLASLVQEVTRVCQVSLVVRVFLELPVWQIKLKDSQECLGFLDDPAHQAFLDPKVKPESLDSRELLDRGVMMVHLVCLVTLENLVVLEARVYLEKHMLIPELQALKDSLEMQVTQVVLALMVPKVTGDYQEVQVTLEQRVVLVKEGSQASRAPPAFPGQKANLASQD